MALEHAILVSLAERPGTGYEIGTQFGKSIGYFWSATRQQIYRTLKKLHDDGLVSYEDIAQDGRPDKKVYSISESGRQTLRDWVQSPTPLTPLRSELGVKLRAAEFGDIPALIEQLRSYRDDNLTQLKLFTGFSADYYADAASLTGRKLHQYLVLRGGIIAAQAAIDWVDEAIAQLEREQRTARKRPTPPRDPIAVQPT